MDVSFSSDRLNIQSTDGSRGFGRPAKYFHLNRVSMQYPRESPVNTFVTRLLQLYIFNLLRVISTRPRELDSPFDSGSVSVPIKHATANESRKS